MFILAPEHISPLAKTHERKSFDCGQEDPNRYLREQARQDAEKRVAASFVLTQLGNPKVLGFYTLSSSIIDALRRSLEAAQQIAAMAVIVDAKNEGAESFYRYFGFQ